jgi:hypothetical protein
MNWILLAVDVDLCPSVVCTVMIRMAVYHAGSFLTGRRMFSCWATSLFDGVSKMCFEGRLVDNVFMELYNEMKSWVVAFSHLSYVWGKWTLRPFRSVSGWRIHLSNVWTQKWRYMYPVTRGSQKIRFSILLPPNNLTQWDASLFTYYSLHFTSLFFHIIIIIIIS